MPAELPLALQTVYAELLDRVTSRDFHEAFPPRGAFVVKTVRGRRYWYFQDTAEQGRRQRYVGPETPELLEQIGQHAEAKGTRNELRALVSTLVRSVPSLRPPPMIGDVVAALAGAGVFRLRGVLIGTVAYQTYPAMLGERLLTPALVQTQDVDIAQFSDVSVAVDDATPPIADVLKHLHRSFRPVPNIAGAQYLTAFRAAGDLRVEFLTPNRGPDSDRPRRLAAFGIDAQPLRFLDFLIHDPEPAVLLHGTGVRVLVPTPQRFAVHKLIVARRRSVGEAKSEKDIRQSASLLDSLIRKRPYELREAWEEAYTHGAAWRRLLGEGIGLVSPDIRDRTLKNVATSRSIIPGLDLQFVAPAIGYDSTQQVAFCFAKAGLETIRCAIAREALEDHFGASGLDQRSRMSKFREHRPLLENLFRIKYLTWPVEEPGSVLLKAENIRELTRAARRRG